MLSTLETKMGYVEDPRDCSDSLQTLGAHLAYVAGLAVDKCNSPQDGQLWIILCSKSLNPAIVLSA
jgi:hypothetical protein